VTYLIDTKVFLWLVFEPEKLSEAAREVLIHPRSVLKLSTASVWEALRKAGKGKLTFLQSETIPADYLEMAIRILNLQPLPVELDHVTRASTLPNLHADPFDRLLIAQALVEGVPIITSDRAIHAYPVRVIW
jgi:PIN domain nuclease of toxin-antitoxin system